MTWTELQRVVFPQDGDPDVLPLYVDADVWARFGTREVRVSDRAHIDDVLARDRFRVASGDSLESLKVGDLSVWIEAGPRAIVAAVIRGTAPQDLRPLLQEAVEEVHRQFGRALDTFEGDTSEFEAARPLLEACLTSEYRQEARTRRGAWILFGLTIAALLIWLGLSYRSQARFSRYLEALAAEGFHQVIHRMRFERAHGVLLVRRDEDGGGHACGPDRGDDIQAGDRRHLDVEEQQVGRQRANGLDGGHAVAALANDLQILRVAQPKHLAHRAGEDGPAERILPQGLQVERAALRVRHEAEDGAPLGKVLDRPHADERDRELHVRDLAGEAEVGRIHEPQHLAGKAGVGFDRRGELGGAVVLVAGELEQTQGALRQGRKLGPGQKILKQQ